MERFATLEQVQGCLLGLALGDALGAPYEGGVLERLVWRAIGKTRSGEMRWTDDTQMSVDLIESYLAQGTIQPDDLARRFAASYRWSRGYGPGAAKMLKRVARGADWREANRSVYRDGSYGNGAAMRAPMLGLIYSHRPHELAEAVRASAVVTHAHPIGIEGAQLVAGVTRLTVGKTSNQEIVAQAMAMGKLPEFQTRWEIVQTWLAGASNVSTAEVRRRLGCGISAHESCLTGVYAALRFRERDFLDMLQFVIELGGDVDTIGAMAGAIWGAINGRHRLPAPSLAQLEQRQRLESLATSLHAHLTANPS